MQSILGGLKDYQRAHRLVFREGLWRWYVAPGLLSLLYFPVVLVLALFRLNDAARHVHVNWIPETLQSPVTAVLLTMVVWILAAGLALVLFRSVVLILYSPVLGYLSEQAERRAFGGTPPKFTWQGALYDAGRGIAMTVLTLVLSVLGMVVCWLLVVIPFIGGLLSVVTLPVVQMFFAGVGFWDPTLGRRRLAVGESLRCCWKHRWRIVGHGLGFSLLVAIPIVGWFLAPSYGVIAGTLGAVKVLGQTKPEEIPRPN